MHNVNKTIHVMTWNLTIHVMAVYLINGRSESIRDHNVKNGIHVMHNVNENRRSTCSTAAASPSETKS